MAVLFAAFHLGNYPDALCIDGVTCHDHQANNLLSTSVDGVDIFLQLSNEVKSLCLPPTRPFRHHRSVSMDLFNIRCRHKFGLLYNLDNKLQYIYVSPFITLQFERIRAYDADLGAYGVVTYYLYGEIAGQLFTIDESTADMQVTPEGTRLLDREIIPNFQVQVGSDF